MGPLMFSLGVRSLLRDLASTLGPDRLILAYLDDIYILSTDDQALEQTLAAGLL
jgi:predicted RecB family endonuclease